MHGALRARPKENAERMFMLTTDLERSWFRSGGGCLGVLEGL